MGSIKVHFSCEAAALNTSAIRIPRIRRSPINFPFILPGISARRRHVVPVYTRETDKSRGMKGLKGMKGVRESRRAAEERGKRRRSEEVAAK